MSDLNLKGAHVEAHLSSEVIDIYPNPVDEFFTIKSSHNGNSNLLVMDLNGRVIMQSTFIGVGTIDASQLKSGVYLIRVDNEIGMSATKRLTVM